MTCAECGNTIYSGERWEVEDWHHLVLHALGHDEGRQRWLCTPCRDEAERRWQDQYWDHLARHVVAAGVIFHDVDQVLLVKPAYRDDTWEVPGGTMEDDDSDPLATARREVGEELGLDIGPAALPLLVVDWIPATDRRPALVNFLFDGGRLTQADIEQRIVLQGEELLACQLTPRDELDCLLLPRLARRVAAALDAISDDATVYLHRGRRP